MGKCAGLVPFLLICVATTLFSNEISYRLSIYDFDEFGNRVIIDGAASRLLLAGEVYFMSDDVPIIWGGVDLEDVIVGPIDSGGLWLALQSPLGYRARSTAWTGATAIKLDSALEFDGRFGLFVRPFPEVTVGLYRVEEELGNDGDRLAGSSNGIEYDSTVLLASVSLQPASSISVDLIGDTVYAPPLFNYSGWYNDGSFYPGGRLSHFAARLAWRPNLEEATIDISSVAFIMVGERTIPAIATLARIWLRNEWIDAVVLGGWGDWGYFDIKSRADNYKWRLSADIDLIPLQFLRIDAAVDWAERWDNVDRFGVIESFGEGELDTELAIWFEREWFATAAMVEWSAFFDAPIHEEEASQSILEAAAMGEVDIDWFNVDVEYRLYFDLSEKSDRQDVRHRIKSSAEFLVDWFSVDIAASLSLPDPAIEASLRVAVDIGWLSISSGIALRRPLNLADSELEREIEEFEADPFSLIEHTATISLKIQL